MRKLVALSRAKCVAFFNAAAANTTLTDFKVSGGYYAITNVNGVNNSSQRLPGCLLKIPARVSGSINVSQQSPPSAKNSYTCGLAYELIFNDEPGWLKQADKVTVIKSKCKGNAYPLANAIAMAKAEIGTLTAMAVAVVGPTKPTAADAIYPNGEGYVNGNLDAIMAKAFGQKEGLSYKLNIKEGRNFLVHNVESLPLSGNYGESAVQVLTKSFKVKPGEVTMIEPTVAEQELTLSYMESASREVAVGLVYDTSNSSFEIVFKLTDEITDEHQIMASDKMLKDINENVAKLTLLSETCSITDKDMESAKNVSLPENLELNPKAAEIKLSYGKYKDFLSAVETQRLKPCDAAKLSEAANSAGLSLNDYLASKRANADAKSVEARDPSSLVWDTIKDTASSIGGGVGSYLSKWSPMDYLKTYAGYTIVDSAKKSSMPSWLVLGGIGLVALVVMK